MDNISYAPKRPNNVYSAFLYNILCQDEITSKIRIISIKICTILTLRLPLIFNGDLHKINQLD